MKLLVRPDGTVELEVSDVSQAVEFARRMAEPRVIDKEAKPKRGRPPHTEDIRPLTDTQSKYWSFLVENDCSAGVAVAEAAEHFEVTKQAAGGQLNRLVELQLAHKLPAAENKPITYRPGVAS